MKWRKLGLAFVPTAPRPWMLTHAANPTPDVLDDGRVRVYFGARDDKNRAHIGWVDLELTPTPRVLQVAEDPVVVPGPLGAFDDSGASMGCLVRDGERTLLYYLGWNLGVTVPWRNSIGLAIREHDGAPFVKYSPAPLLDRSACDPFSISYPFVLHERDRWHIWYGSNLKWGSEQSDMDHVIKHDESDDGLHWRREGRIAIDLLPPEEYAVCRPWVVHRGDKYHMWYCHRGEAYRIGYAESHDGLRWTRRPDLVGIDVSAAGWDSEMMSYAAVFEHRGSWYMLYNGNGYGKTGFGLAVLEGELT